MWQRAIVGLEGLAIEPLVGPITGRAAAVDAQLGLEDEQHVGR